MNSEKHILFMVGATYVAGAEITNFNLIRDMHQQGYKILVVVSGWNDGDFINRLNQFNIPYKAIKLGWFFIKNPSWVLDSLIHYPKAFWQLRKILKEFKPVWIFHYRL
jgi:UDP-N-acetylglucosamine:LPS N-acetylglucosamine transferase